MHYINGDKMKKIILLGVTIITLLTILVGCSLSNTPTSKVEELFSKYQKLDKDIEGEIDDLLASETLTEDQKDRYRKVIENQYKKLTYEIKDEKIDGDNAVVTTQIEVLDYRKAISELNTEVGNDYDILEYNNKKLDKLEGVKDKVAYTLEINVVKDDDGNWKLSNLSSNDIKKIQGMY